MQPVLRNLVQQRASDRCEYCQIRQDQDQYYEFHVEHIIARQHGGRTEATNLAWLQINNDDRVELREVLIDQGLFPPRRTIRRPRRRRRA